MLRTILGYTAFNDDVQFLLLKQDVITNPLWKSVFYIHVFSAINALLAGSSQFFELFLKENRKLHRFFGHIYVWNALVINCPKGLILAIYANGGMLARQGSYCWMYYCLFFWLQNRCQQMDLPNL